jgi:SAM-dependent methyltransferase
MRQYIKLILPPIIVIIFKRIYYFYILKINSFFTSKNKQDIKIYDKKITAEKLEQWGRDSTWNEILMLINKKSGNILDVACGTGFNLVQLKKINPQATFYGCDISSQLITIARQKGIDQKYLNLIDATKMKYPKNFFSHSYSIGSLEHFTEQGIESVITKLSLNTSISSFHFMPVSRKNINEGWIKTFQTFHNNSVEWWREKFKRKFKTVEVIDSSWNDFISVGKWFLCFKK